MSAIIIFRSSSAICGAKVFADIPKKAMGEGVKIEDYYTWLKQVEDFARGDSMLRKEMALPERM